MEHLFHTGVHLFLVQMFKPVVLGEYPDCHVFHGSQGTHQGAVGSLGFWPQDEVLFLHHIAPSYSLKIMMGLKIWGRSKTRPT